ncbi:CDC27 [Symbiodinium sp. CCMP2456]|nr:CDC27 [Symbiodinium sp. CCMP2456]
MAFGLALLAFALSGWLAKVTTVESRICAVGRGDQGGKHAMALALFLPDAQLKHAPPAAHDAARGVLALVVKLPLPFAVLVLPGSAATTTECSALYLRRILEPAVLESSLLTGAVVLATGSTFSYLIRGRKQGMKRVNDDDEEERGWMALYGDVFRPPPLGGALGLMVGAGVSTMLTELAEGLYGHSFFSDCLAVACASFCLGRLHGALGTSCHAAFVASILVVLLQIAVYLDELRALQTNLRVTWFVALHGFAFVGVHTGCQFSALRPNGFFTGFKKIHRVIPHSPLSQLAPLFGEAALMVWIGMASYSYWPSQLFQVPASVSATLAVVCSQLSLLMIHRRLTQEDYRWWWLSYCYGAFMSFCFDAFRVWTDCEDQARSACGVALLGSLQNALIAGSTSFLMNLRSGARVGTAGLWMDMRRRSHGARLDQLGRHGFNCQQAVDELSSLPKRHYETGYVLDLVGLSHFESADYKKSELAYNQAWRVEPHRVEGLEYYSSALWHLRRDVELCRLAQQCLQWDRLRPQVWCVVGNCFSLQKEHDAAIKLFKRAIQVDANFTYAYTLCGHEFVASEKIDKAVAMYENALNLDPRHYNAWWGLGNIYHRQEEHENAKYHFYKALQVNASNSVLRCYLGMVLSALKQPLLALDSFDQAAQAEPQNGMAYFQKACVLISLDRHEEALADLKKVRCLAPKEACVHFQLGKVYMKLQKDRKALYHFNIAMDLNRDSKDYHTIKTHIEKLHIRGISEDSTGEASAGAGAHRIMSAAPPVLVTGGLSSPVAAQQLYGLSPGSRPGSEAPQTPAVRGVAGGFWSASASGSGGPPERVRAYPVTAQRGRGSPLSWGGSPGNGLQGSSGFRI